MTVSNLSTLSAGKCAKTSDLGLDHLSNLKMTHQLFCNQLKFLKPYLTFLKVGSQKGMNLPLSYLIGSAAGYRARRARAVVYKRS